MGFVKPRVVRIASASGSVTDRRHGFADLAQNEELDFIVGDWMSEYNMTSRGGSKMSNDSSTSQFEDSFLESITPALGHLAQNNIKVAVNAGASDTRALYDVLVQVISSQSLSLRVAWIEGDEVFDSVRKTQQEGGELKSLTTGKPISAWGFEPIYAQCYLGGWGIVEALNHGADIVLCGRVADASPTIACAAYHHGWRKDNFTELAHAFVAGHFIECSTYVTGGNFTGFKALAGRYLDLGFPIVEIESSGQFTVTKQKNRDGFVTVETCKAQLLYEIQGPYYYNSDVVAVLDKITMEEIEANKVQVSNVTGLPPPPTTKVGITAKGGFQAEVHYFLCGLDMEEKAAMAERQIRHLLDESRFHTLKFRKNGSCPPNPSNQDSATVDLRIFAQSKDENALSHTNFFRPCTDIIMQSYPGATFAVDARQAAPKPYYEYWVSIIPQASIKHICHVPYKDVTITIDPPAVTREFLYEQSSYETETPATLSSFGPSTIAPMGYIVHARSGDKGSDCNVGFFVRYQDEWDWLRSFLTIDKIKLLLGEDYIGKPVFRFELPELWAVHFLLKDHLDRGVSSSSTYDVLGKNLAEYLRCKLVEIPVKFLRRGRI